GLVRGDHGRLSPDDLHLGLVLRRRPPAELSRGHRGRAAPDLPARVPPFGARRGRGHRVGLDGHRRLAPLGGGRPRRRSADLSLGAPGGLTPYALSSQRRSALSRPVCTSSTGSHFQSESGKSLPNFPSSENTSSSIQPSKPPSRSARKIPSVSAMPSPGRTR